MALIVNNRYAGDSAWKEWFKTCAVANCSTETAARLRSQIKSAMLAQLLRFGFSPEIAEEDDPVMFFDSYFKLKGTKDRPKPLKSYFAHRIAADGLKLVNFVCGTLFGSASGRIHDIVLDWVATLKGWKPRSLRGTDGKRHLVWEGASAEDCAALELAVENDPASTIDADAFRTLVTRLLETLARKIKAEKSVIALLLYATAQDVSITDAAVLAGLKVGKSRAYALREKIMELMRRELKAIDGAEDPLFGRVLIETCEMELSADMLAKMGGHE